MEWTDDGIVLGVRRHGEGSVIAELLTREHGRHLGLVRGGTSARMRPVLQPGNTVRAVWRARLDEHLGNYALEGLILRAAKIMTSSHAVFGVTHLASLARLLPERDPHQDIYEMLEHALSNFDDARLAAIQLVQFELTMLAELGFGLDTAGCGDWRTGAGRTSPPRAGAGTSSGRARSSPTISRAAGPSSASPSTSTCRRSRPRCSQPPTRCRSVR
jgi:DNA repair protein RecO (recombination protein O)